MKKEKWDHIILGICIFLAISSFLYIKYVDRYYFSHYHRYYADSLKLYDDIKELDYKGFYKDLLFTYIDKIISIRPLIFYLLFGQSELMFFYSSAVLNIILLMLFYISLKKFFKPQKSAAITMFTCLQFFFLILLASFYIDLTYFLIWSIYFIYLYGLSIQENAGKHFFALTLLTFALFSARNMSYLIMPFIISGMSLYFLMMKKKEKIFPLIASGFCGFILYFIIFLSARIDFLIRDIACAPLSSMPFSSGILDQFYLNFRFFLKEGILKNTYLFQKTPFLLLNLAIYFPLIYSIIKKKNLFWAALFIIGDIFYFFLFNINGEYPAKIYFLPFYFVYIMLIFELIEDFINSYFHERKGLIAVILILLIFAISLFQIIYHPYDNGIVSRAYNIRILDGIENTSRIHFKVGEDIESFYTIDYNENPKKDYSRFIQYEPSFGYTFVSSPEDADYIVCENCTSFKKYPLIKTQEFSHQRVPLYLLKVDP